MNEYMKKACGAAGSVVLLTSLGAGGIAAASQHAFADDAAVNAGTETCADAGAASNLVQSERVMGEFSFAQGEVTPVDALKKHVAGASKYLCSAAGRAAGGDAVDPGAWAVAVRGDVGNAFVATMDELAENGSAQLTMGCSCAGNPADGLASGNAEVLGVTLFSIIEAAQVDENANTIVFTSADGYEIALPLLYVAQHFSLLAYDINGEPVDNSMGGANQLWLGSTAASYFARDVVGISFETRETPPPTPGTAEAGDAYANVPNVAIAEGGTAS